MQDERRGNVAGERETAQGPAPAEERDAEELYRSARTLRHREHSPTGDVTEEIERIRRAARRMRDEEAG